MYSCPDLGGNIMANRILIVDDEPLIVKALKYSLEQDNYETDSAADGEEALEKFFAGRFDLILLDVMLPKADGIEVCQRIREKSNVPIIMLTAKGEDMDKILGLEYGADDYMTKPFNILEVKARIKTILRRTTTHQKETVQSVVTIRDMCINLNNRSVTIGNKEINLTAKEFDLLQLFVNNRGKVFSRENLLETIWKYDYLGDLRTVDVHIRRLREKIEKIPDVSQIDVTNLNDQYAIDILKLIYNFEEVLVQVTKKNEPSILSRYLIDLAKSFSSYYNENKIIVEDVPFLTEIETVGDADRAEYDQSGKSKNHKHIHPMLLEKRFHLFRLLLRLLRKGN